MSQFRHAVWVRLGLRPVVFMLVLGGLILAGCASSRGGTGSSNSVSAQTATHSPAQPAGGGTPKTAASTGGSVGTTVRTFAPFDRSGAPTAGVAAHRSGSCFTTSITVPVRGAYRCFAANTILDPCFRSPTAQHLLDCYLTPWSRAIELRVAKLPNAPLETGITRPWAIELAGGIRCVVTNGTPSILHGVALVYQCPDGWAGLPGAARSSTGGAADVTAVYRATDGAVRRLAVRTEWRARPA